MIVYLNLFDSAPSPARSGGKLGHVPTRAGVLSLLLVTFLSLGLPSFGWSSIPRLPDGARLVFDEDWSSEEIDA